MATPRFSQTLREDRRPHGAWVGVLLVSWFALTGAARAQETVAPELHADVTLEAPAVTVESVAEPVVEEPAPPEYTRAIDAAVQAHGRGDFLEARNFFERAHRIYPNARSLRGLGHVEFELGNYVKAVKYLSASLDSQVKPLDALLAERVRALLDQAKARVGMVRLDVKPQTTRVSLDGSPVGDELGTTIFLAPGDHVFEFRAQRRLSERRELRVEGGEEIVIQVALSSLAAPPAPAESARSQVESSRGTEKRRKRWLWASSIAAVVVGGTVTALVLGLRDPQGEVHPRAPQESPWSPPGVVLMALGKRE